MSGILSYQAKTRGIGLVNLIMYLSLMVSIVSAWSNKNTDICVLYSDQYNTTDSDKST